MVKECSTKFVLSKWVEQHAKVKIGGTPFTKKFSVCGSSIWVLNGWIIHFEVGHHQVAEGGVHRELPDTTTNLTVIHNLVNKPSTKDKILEPSRTPKLVIRRVEIETLPC